MTKTIHNVYIGTMVLIAMATTAYIAIVGNSYYAIPLEERFYHPQHEWFKPSGTFGHGLGIAPVKVQQISLAVVGRQR